MALDFQILSRIVQSPSTADQSSFLLNYLFRQNQASQQYKDNTTRDISSVSRAAGPETSVLSMGFLCKLLLPQEYCHNLILFRMFSPNVLWESILRLLGDIDSHSVVKADIPSK